MKTAEALVQAVDAPGVRLDVFISEVMGLFSRSQVRARVLAARVNGEAARLSRRLKNGDSVSVDYSEAPPMRAVPEDLPLEILFENDDVIVVNKPQGMVVHPGSGNHASTLVNALLFHCSGLGAAFGDEPVRPGIVHRLDKDTSGVMIAAKNPRAHAFLASQFAARETRKRYVALVCGCPSPAQGRVETRILRDPASRKKFVCAEAGGKYALTFYTVLRAFTSPPNSSGRGPASYSLVSLRPRTGRTHQLRVHMRRIGTPIVGDPVYGKPDPFFKDATLMLHAHRLKIRIPGEPGGREFMASLPPRFKAAVRSLQSFSPKQGL